MGTSGDSSMGARWGEPVDCAVPAPSSLAWWAVHTASVVEQGVRRKGMRCVGVGAQGSSAGPSSGLCVDAWGAVVSQWSGVRRSDGVAEEVAVAHWGIWRGSDLGEEVMMCRVMSARPDDGGRPRCCHVRFDN